MKSKYVQLVSAIIFIAITFVYLFNDNNTGMFGSLILAKLCAMQYSIEDEKENNK